MVFELNKALHLVSAVKRYIPTRADTYQIFGSTLHMRKYGRFFVDFYLRSRLTETSNCNNGFKKEVSFCMVYGLSSKYTHRFVVKFSENKSGLVSEYQY